jgi:hypothetical protein
MFPYFLAGNLWLIFGVLAIVGRKLERSEPDRYSFFGFGRWFEPQGYTVFVYLLFVVAAACFLLHWWAGRAKS